MSRWDSVPAHGYGDDDESEDEGTASGHNKAKPRRKSHQRPQGSDQIRQAFSKRKKGLVLKAYQLNSLTDAKVFMFIVNDKGTSWAYATPGFNSSLNPQVLKQLRTLAEVPESAKIFTEVIPCPNTGKNTSSNGSSEQTGTQRTEPSADYVPPSTRTATGALPARSRSSYSWGSEGQAPGPQGADKLTRTASNAAHAANARAMQPTPQSDEHSPTLPKARPPSGNSMACGTRPGMAAPGAAAAAGGPGFSHQAPYTQQQLVAGRGPGMEPPTPCGMYNLLGEPISAQDSPTEVAMSCGGGSPSSKLMPPPDAAATGRLLAANAAAAAAAAGGAQGAAGGAVGMEGVQVDGSCKIEAAGDWAPQQQLQEAGASWDLQAYQQQQQYMQQQMVMQQQQQYMQQHYQQQQGNFLMGAPEPGSAAPVDIPYSACPSAAGAGCNGTPWGSLPSGVGSGLQGSPVMGTQPMDLQQQQFQDRADAFECVQRALAPLRLLKQYGGPGGDPDGCRSAPAAGAGMNSVMGPPSQWVHFPDSSNAAAGAESGMGNMRAASDAGVYGAQAYSSYAPSPSSCANQGTSGNGSTPATGVGMPNAAQALLLSRAGGSISQSPSPTAALGARLNVMAMRSASNSPLHPSAMGEQYMQQQGGWGSASRPASQDGGAAAYQQQQHNQGAYMPQTDDLVSDPIVEMLMDKPMNQLAHDQHAGAAADSQHRHLSIMEATLQQQQDGGGCRMEGAPGMPPPAAGSAAGGSPPLGTPQGAPAPGIVESVATLLSHIPPPPKTDAPADKAAWQAEVRRILGTLQPQQRQELAKLSEQQFLMAQSGSSAPGGGGSSSSALESLHQNLFGCGGPPLPAASAGAAGSGPASSGGYGRAFGGKARLGPSRLSANSPAVDLTPASSADAAAAAAWLGDSTVPVSLPCGVLPVMPHQQLPVGSTFFMGNEGAVMSSSGMQAQATGEAMGGGSSSQDGAGFCLPPPSDSSAMGLPKRPVSSSGMKYICPTSAMTAPCESSGICASVGFSDGGSSGAGRSSCSGQMLPLPQQHMPAAAAEPALANSLNGSDPFAAGGGQGPNGSAAFVQAAAAARTGTLLSELRGVAGSPCPSPLKRSQPTSGPFGAAEDGTASPLKRACPANAFDQQQQQQGQQQPPRLPEPPSFATLMQAEASGEDDAIAWAVAASDSMKRVAGSCVSLGVSAAMSSLDSFPSAFLRLGSLQGVDSMQLLSALADVGEDAGQGANAAAGDAQAEGAGQEQAVGQAS